ncbi:DUF2970 domain-containing protein [Oceanicoccus sp. KOV_DT_Chl]|uniref:DUF2970 domain-containing protein n=1 Tax=Oceanicoccus sp. KOV_DT_Chl TaxID=1904639 RepID=UPI000C7A2C46|nr:DUF2970 domain-containing protein [Oceanicoccus sp. KOV_DT_Chl]
MSKQKKPRYFERPDEDEAPLGFWATLLIVLSTHLGVRPKAKREEDFRRANGLHVFVAGVIYFVVLLIMMVILVNVVSH